ncbi:hypothetical protein BF503P1_00028 [Bacteroides phage BF503P1]|nr:hypothetical protein BF503P1_00028 [Bacteroides phage BF503P1]
MPKSKTKKLRRFAQESRKREPVTFWKASVACTGIANKYKKASL